jgi:hypothetical protein
MNVPPNPGSINTRIWRAEIQPRFYHNITSGNRWVCCCLSYATLLAQRFPHRVTVAQGCPCYALLSILYKRRGRRDIIHNMNTIVSCVSEPAISSWSHPQKATLLYRHSISIYHHAHHRDNVAAPHGHPNRRSRLHIGHNGEGRPQSTEPSDSSDTWWPETKSQCWTEWVWVYCSIITPLKLPAHKNKSCFKIHVPQFVTHAVMHGHNTSSVSCLSQRPEQNQLHCGISLICKQFSEFMWHALRQP